jgi:hypothetical protein
LSFDPSYEPGKVYPLSSDNDGYKITLKVIDSYDNESESFEELELRVEDTRQPVFTMIGPETIHDFFRYGARPGIANQDLFDDRDVTPEYNGTGFPDGAHRLMLADYNFVDPGIYAEDSSFSLSEYPDFDGDGVGEAHARRKINQGESFPDINDAEVGVIYYKSLLSETTLGDVQNLLENNSTTVMSNVSSKVFYEDGSASELNKKIKEFTILYKVWDGWGNFAEDNRTIYIYESERASADKAFFATPIDHTSLEDNVTSFADLSIVQTDYDGDGVSDFWEMALGTRYDDPQSTPDHNFSNKTSFEALIGANMTELRDRIAQIKDNPEYGLNQFSGYLEFNGTD